MEYSDHVKQRARAIADSVHNEMLRQGVVSTVVYDHCLPAIEGHVADLIIDSKSSEASSQRLRRSRILDLAILSTLALVVIQWLFS